MKGSEAVNRILGSLLLLTALLWGAAEREYYFKADLSKTELYTGEMAVLTVSFYRHRDINTVLGRFKPHSHDAISYEEFRIESESEGEYDIEHYVYLLHFKKAGEYTLPVTAEVRKYNEQDLVDSSNHRDAMNVAAASTEAVDVARFKVSVKASGSRLPAGEFVLTLLPEETRVLEHEPAHFTVTIEGEGDINALPFPDVAIDGAKVFVQEGERNRWLDGKRIMGRKSNQYAVVASGDFHVPVLGIEYFSTRTGRVEQSRSRAADVTVRHDPAFARESLLDPKPAVESETLLPSVDTLMEWGLYGLLFFSGYLVAGMKIRLPKRHRHPVWIEELKKSRDQKELLARLLPYVDHPVCREYIEKLEADSTDSGEFSKLKQKLVSALLSDKKSVR